MFDPMVWVVILILITIVLTFRSERGMLEAKINDLQRQLNTIAEHVNIKVKDVTPPEVVGLIKLGRKIEAIKVYRRETGAGLVAAKAAVERIQAETMGTSGTIIQT